MTRSDLPAFPVTPACDVKHNVYTITHIFSSPLSPPLLLSCSFLPPFLPFLTSLFPCSLLLANLYLSFFYLFFVFSFFLLSHLSLLLLLGFSSFLASSFDLFLKSIFVLFFSFSFSLMIIDSFSLSFCHVGYISIIRSITIFANSIIIITITTTFRITTPPQ